jgi:thymidylate synthase (FAD)
MRFIKPSVYLIAETAINDASLQDMLEEIGVPTWNTNAPSDAEKLTEVAGKMCYMSFHPDLNKNLTKVRDNRNRDYIQDGLIKVNHGSVLEHSSMTFALLNVSRVFTHELVRHRAGCAYSQQSGRYVRINELQMYQPDCLSPHELELLTKALEQIELSYQSIEKEVFVRVGDAFFEKKRVTSALRRMLPNGQVNNIIFTCNHRALRHIIEQRVSPHAEEEVYRVFSIIKEMVKKKYPNIYEDIA